MDTIELEFNQRIKVTVDLPRLAQFFAMMDCERQAQFFVEVAKVAHATYEPGIYSSTPEGTASFNWFQVGRELLRGLDDTELGREMLRDIMGGIEDVPEPFVASAAQVNALPLPVRRYVHDLETRCDPAGDTRTIWELREQLAAAARQIEKLEADVKRVDELRAEERRARW